MLAAGQRVAHLLSGHAVVVLVHLRPFEKLIGGNHVDERVPGDEVMVHSVLLAGARLTRGYPHL